VPSTLPLKLPCELALGGELAPGGEPLEACRSSQEGLIARLECLLHSNACCKGWEPLRCGSGPMPMARAW
jgi:hypothetical protein